MNDKILYTQEQLDIALLKNTNEGILSTLKRLEQRLESNFHWMLGSIFGLYAIMIGSLITALGKAYKLF